MRGCRARGTCQPPGSDRNPRFPARAGGLPSRTHFVWFPTIFSPSGGLSGKHLSPSSWDSLPNPPPRQGLAPQSGVGVFSLPGCLSHLGPPPHLLSSPAENYRSLQYHFTAVSAPAAGTPAFWVSGWLGPQQYLSYNNLRAQAEPYGAWVWESQVSWYWEKETMDLRNQETLFLEALQALGEGETGTSWAGSLYSGSEGGGDGGTLLPGPLIRVWAPQAPSPCRACWAASWALTISRCRWPSLP